MPRNLLTLPPLPAMCSTRTGGAPGCRWVFVFFAGAVLEPVCEVVKRVTYKCIIKYNMVQETVC